MSGSATIASTNPQAKDVPIMWGQLGAFLAQLSPFQGSICLQRMLHRLQRIHQSRARQPLLSANAGCLCAYAKHQNRNLHL
uniref:Uncharacterized protein n=1 Tax=Arundo donax TaxID=35708 RepID=A0A0A9UYU0_ARUDO